MFILHKIYSATLNIKKSLCEWTQFYYNRPDDRIHLIGGLGLPDVIEKENDTFDIVLIQKIGKHWEVKLTGQNLNNEPYTLLQGGGIYHYYKKGRTFKLGISWKW